MASLSARKAERKEAEAKRIAASVWCGHYTICKLTSFLEHAGSWFLHSGIQEPEGGVARYYVYDPGKNAPVSSEITGYAVSALLYLHSVTGVPAYLDAGLRAARYLICEAWDCRSSTFPFEPRSDRAYFFDIGIMVRGLLAAWRATGDETFLEKAREGALSLAFDFMGDGWFYPVVSLPDKQPLPLEPRWSRSPGCYQLKSALAWREAGDEHAVKLYESVLAYSLATHKSFPGSALDREGIMDRLHAYCYFLEGLLPVADREDVRIALQDGLSHAAALFEEIAPEFERSDVSAQLLRVRLIAHHMGVLPLDRCAAQKEVQRMRSFQSPPDVEDARLRGGFFFGKKQGKLLPFSNPVSTAFCLQALELWEQHESGRWTFQFEQLI